MHFLMIHLVEPISCSIPLEALASLAHSLSHLSSADFVGNFLAAAIEGMPTSDKLNGFMKTSFNWGLNTGKGFISLLLAYKLAVMVFK